MSRRMVFMLVFSLALCVSVIGVFAQENDNSTPGDAALAAFFNNLGANTQTTSNDIPDVNRNEPNWCTQSDRWSDGRCNNSDSWILRYNWYIGWVLAHCEIPGYFSPENYPHEICAFGAGASPDEVYRTLFPSVGNDDDTDTSDSAIVVTEPTEATPTEATPTEATPTEATPTEATPTEATPTEATPTEATPTEATPTEATPTEATPTEATPTEATPTEATPTEATPTEATPTEATPTEATPTEATPTEATPTEATPTEATPTEATPTEPANVAPTASFGFSCTDLTCSFDGSGSSDSDGSIVSYSWSFDGSGSAASNTFVGTGTYSVTLTVTDDDGATGSNTQSVTVTAPNVAPTASFTFSCVNLVCNFDGSGSSDGDGSIVSYSWSFGGTGSTASNTFASAGTNSVTLTVTDNLGATATSTQNVTVTAPVSPILVASHTCSGNNIIVTITSGEGPFTIEVSGPDLTGYAIGTYNIGVRTGVVKVIETTGDEQEVSFGSNPC
jgi:PKD repeat protein